MPAERCHAVQHDAPQFVRCRKLVNVVGSASRSISRVRVPVRLLAAKPKIRSAPQPVKSRSCSRSASQPARHTQLVLSVGSFNFGTSQDSLSTDKDVSKNFARICAKAVDEGNLDFFFGCHVGDAQKGLTKAGYNIDKLLCEPFKQQYHAREIESYVTTWGFGGASQPVQANLVTFPEIYTIPAERFVQAAVCSFVVRARTTASQFTSVFLVVGNMHVNSFGEAPTERAKERTLHLLRQYLDKFQAPEPQMPVVRVIVGDDDLTATQAQQVLQRQWESDPLWEVMSANIWRDAVGDHISVCGATAERLDIAVGASYTDRGMREDCHDVVAAKLCIRVVSHPLDDYQPPARSRSLPTAAPQSKSKARSPLPRVKKEEVPSLTETEDNDVDFGGSSAPRSPFDPLEEQADSLHAQLRKVWEEQSCRAHCDSKVVGQVARLLFPNSVSLEGSNGVI